MACASSKPIACSFFGNGKTTCGESRGKVDVISLIVNSAISIQNVVKKCSRVLNLLFYLSFLMELFTNIAIFWGIYHVTAGKVDIS